MAILVNDDTKVVVQGITGYQGQFHTKLMLEYGTKVVAGVTPGKHGQEVHEVPVFDLVEEAVDETKANASIIFVPAPFAGDAILEAIEVNLDPIVVITEHIPVMDTIKAVEIARQAGITIIGPNTPGIISPGKTKIGIMPAHVFEDGPIGLVSRSGTLTYEIANAMTKKGQGQSTCIGMGGDPITGITFLEALSQFETDSETNAIVLVGEIGGDAEEKAAIYAEEHVSKPIVAFVAGRTAPPGKRMGHAGAIISGSSGTATHKIKAFENAGIQVASKPIEIADLLAELL
ncbi:MAG: succinate--CoA ligase subunit alpha [Promethearchaeota archaeon]